LLSNDCDFCFNEYRFCCLKMSPRVTPYLRLLSRHDAFTFGKKEMGTGEAAVGKVSSPGANGLRKIVLPGRRVRSEQSGQNGTSEPFAWSNPGRMVRANRSLGAFQVEWCERTVRPEQSG
jgi:hypothetical protein